MKPYYKLFGELPKDSVMSTHAFAKTCHGEGDGAEYGPWLRAPAPGKRIGEGNEWMRGKVGAAQSHNGGFRGPVRREGRNWGSHQRRMRTAVIHQVRRRLRWGQNGQIEGHPMESFHLGEDQMDTGKEGNCYVYNAG